MVKMTYFQVAIAIFWCWGSQNTTWFYFSKCM